MATDDLTSSPITTDPTPTSSLTLSTDQPDYAPGSTATFTVSGASANDTLDFVVVDTAGNPVSGTNAPWTVTADASGTTTTTWAVGLDAAGEAFTVQVLDETTGQAATAAFTDSKPTTNTNTPTEPPIPSGVHIIDLATSTNTHPTDAGAIWGNVGSAINTNVGSSGTGNFSTFSRVQDKPTEQGVNTDAANPILDEKSGAWTHSLSLSSLQAVDNAGNPVADGTPGSYYAFKLDIHQSANYLSLDELQIFQAGTGTLNGYTPGLHPDQGTGTLPGATKIYDLDTTADGNTTVLLNSGFSSGSGGGSDMVVLIPTANFNPANGDFVYLYSAFGYQGGGWAADATFEEWGALTKPGTTTGSTPDAVVAVDKQISVDGGNTWLDQGLFVPNTDSSAAPVVLTGSSVTYRLLVTNDTTPNASNPDPLMDVTDITDINGPTNFVAVTSAAHSFNIGDLNNNGHIDVGETWVYIAQTPISAVSGTQLDTATVTGTVSDANGSTTSSNSDSANYIGVTPQIAIDKVTVDGTVGADGTVTGLAGDGLTIIAGENITWEYKVTNPGDVALSNIVVTDNQSGVTPTALLDGSGHNIGDSNHDGKLDHGETWIYTATGTAIDGNYSNTGKATGSFTDDAGHTANPDATNDSNYTGVAPQIAIDKVTVDGTVGADGTVTGLAGDGLTIIAGESITWEYKVTNPGDVALSNIIVTDNQSGVTPTALLDGSGHNIGDTDGDGKLDHGETWIYTATGTAIDGNYSNTGKATGSFTDDAGHTATPDATNDSNYTGVAPQIAIDKVTVDGTVGADGTVTGLAGDGLTIFAGESITWEYKVTNPGDVALSNIIVTDNQSGVTPTALLNGSGHNIGDTDNDGKLDHGETWIYTATGTAIAGNYSNTGKATGSFTDDAGHTATPKATDDSNYTGLAPSINIEKLVSIDGTNWYTLSDANDNHTLNGDGNDTTLAAISAATGISIGNLHYGTPTTIAGASLTYEFVVTNTGNVDLSNVVLHDVNNVTNTAIDLNGGAIGNDITIGSLAAGGPAAIVTFTTTAGTGVGNMDTATATAGTITDSAGHHVTPSDSDSAAYTGLAPALSGLSQGYWKNHTSQWDGVGNGDLNPSKTALLLGDVDHSGGPTNGEHIVSMSLAAAQDTQANPGSGSADNILMVQLVAAQLNDYQDGGKEPNGLIEAGVNWISTAYTAGTLSGGSVDLNGDGTIETSTGLLTTGIGKVTSGSATVTNLSTSTLQQLYIGESVTGLGIANNSTISSINLGGSSITLNHNATSSVTSDSLSFTGLEYNTSSHTYSANVSTSSAAWTAFAQVFNEAANSYTAIDGHQYTVTADGEGLKNALQAYDQGQLVISNDGSLIGWNNGSTITDVHANTTGAFWGILEDQNLLHPGTIVGVAHA